METCSSLEIVGGYNLTNYSEYKDGNKGTITEIKPDCDMPIDEDGNRAELILNPLGIVNRLNISQLYEHEINFISIQIVEGLKYLDLEEREELYFDYLKIVNIRQYENFKESYDEMDIDGKKCFFDDILENGIYILVEPFFSEIDFFKIMELYEEFGITPLKVKTVYNGKNIEIDRKLIIADMYFMRLRHDSKGKFSARSSGYLNIASVPSKNNRQYKERRSLYSKTAVRLGKQKLLN